MNPLVGAALASCAVGFVSVSQEMAWVRAIGFARGGLPTVFAEVVGFFLVGLALGGLLGKRWASVYRERIVTVAGACLIAAAWIAFVLLPAVGRLMEANKDLGFALAALGIAAVAALGGATFPLLCELGSRANVRPGAAVAIVTASNILGATGGPLVTGYLLFDLWGLERLVVATALFSLAIGGVLLAVAPSRASFPRLRGAGLALVSSAAMIAMDEPLYAHLLERLQLKEKREAEEFRRVVQNKHGTITVLGPDPDTVFGGGMYDGNFNLDPVTNENKIRRGYMVPLLHPRPERILEIGLSTGSWSAVLTHWEPLRTLDIVEINPGYVDLVRAYPLVAPQLDDPRVTIHVDDGRRWLARHPERKYDFILMNMTFHFRGSATNLLSREFMELAKSHLNEGGVFYFNTTGSLQIAQTAAHVFKHVTRYVNFVAASDAPFDVPLETKWENLRAFRVNGQPVFAEGTPAWDVAREMVEDPLTDLGDALRAGEDIQLVTDDNMYTEYKSARGVAGPPVTWAALYREIQRQRQGMGPDAVPPAEDPDGVSN